MLLFFLVCVGFGNELDLSQILFVSETPFRQTLDCISTGNDFRKQFPRKLQISPFWTFYGGDYVRPETKCHHSASIPCFRAVKDELFTQSDLDRIRLDVDSEISNVVRIVSDWLRDDFGLSGIERSWHHFDRFNSSQPRPCRFHADNFNIPGYQYTALIYLNSQGDDFEDGETLFVDEAKIRGTTFEVSRGLAVSPRKGRVAVFSGGLENVHCARQSLGGRREVIQLWFRCEDFTEPKAIDAIAL